MTHREATASDCPLLGAMNHQLIQDEGHRNPMTVAELAERMRGWLASGVYRAIFFEHDSAPLAYALFRNRVNDFKRRANFAPGTLKVAPANHSGCR